MIPSHLQSECVELLAKYEIVLNLGESHYFIPSMLPNNLQHSSVLGDGPVNKYALSSTIIECEDDDLSDGDANCDDDRGCVHGDNDRACVHGDDDRDHANNDGDDDDDDDDENNYVNIMVDRAKFLNDISNSTVAKRPKSTTSSSSSSSPSSSCEAHVKWKIPDNSANANRQSTWPDFFNFNLHASNSFDKAENLFSPYKYKENLSSVEDNQIDITLYPTLCRIWLSPFIPRNFWFRLVSRIISSVEIASVIARLLPTVDSNSVKDTSFSLWSLWQQGIAVIHKDITLIEMKYEGNVKRNGVVVGQEKQQKLLLSISTPEFLAYHQRSNTSLPDESLSSEDILSQVTKLLVLIEQLILDICEWFPGALTQDLLGGVASYIPCCFCLQNERSFKYFTSSRGSSTIISYDDHELYCFSFTEMLASYTGDTVVVCPCHGQVPVHLCAPDIVSYF